MTESRGRTVQRLMACIALPSPTPPGEVGAVADWIEEWAISFGARVERQEVEPDKDNVLATMDFGPGPTLVFNSHMDVNNPAGQVWQHPPFEPFLTEDRLYGLGACDAKGSLVAMLCAMERLAERREGLGGKLTLTAVMGEEAGGIGSFHLVRQGIQADGAVVGEPTGLQVAVAHKGTYMRKIAFRGRAVHSGSAHLGINAIHHAALFCVECEALNRRLAEAPHPLLGPATAAVTMISGGTRQNTIPGRAELIVDRRLLPGETHAKADEELAAILSELKRRVPELDVEPVEVIVATIPSQTQEGAAILPAALAAADEVLGGERHPAGFSAGCDMSKLAELAGIPTIIVGPGSLTEAHAPDEFVDLDQLDKAVCIYERIARKFLTGKEGTS